jgi:hypothetical protein
MIIKREPGESGNIIATIAIGDDYFKAWEKYALPLWLKYCENHDIGLVVFTDNLISISEKSWKKATWQKLLIGDVLEKSQLNNLNNVCYLDTDILINPLAPNVFDYHDESLISLVSIWNNLPYSFSERYIKKLIAFNRNKYYSKDYPLDSALFISLENLYKFHGLPVQNDEACMGLIVFNINNFSSIMKKWFMKYDHNVASITGNGDQTHLNYEIQNYGKVKWLDYRFQALWVYEMVIKYPFLYKLNGKFDDSVVKTVQASLQANYFLHFAGSWHESEMWEIDRIIDQNFLNELNEFSVYKKIPSIGDAVGVIKPKN